MREKELESLRVVLRYLDRQQIEFEKNFPKGNKLPLWEHCDVLQEYLDYEKDMNTKCKHIPCCDPCCACSVWNMRNMWKASKG